MPFSRVLNTVFWPTSFDSGSIGLKAWFDSSQADVVLEPGTEDGLRRFASMPNMARARTGKPGLGGSWIQNSFSIRPVMSTFPEGRVTYFAGVNRRIHSNLAAEDFRFLHDGSGCTLFVVPRLIDVSAGNQCFAATSTLSTDAGLGVRALNTGAVQVRIGDGSASEDINTATGLITDQTTHIVCVRHDSSRAVKVDVRVDGVQRATLADYATIAPSSSDPTDALMIGATTNGLNPINGYLPELLVFNCYLTDEECAQVEAYLSRWVIEVIYDQLATAAVASLYGLQRFYHSNGLAWVDLLGNGSPVEAGSPTHGTDAVYGGRNVMTLDGSTQWVDDNSYAALISGNEVPNTIISLGDIAVTGDYIWAAALEEADVARHELALSTTWNHTRRNDVPTGTTRSIGTNTTNPTRIAVASGEGNADGYQDGSLVVNDQVTASGVATYNTFRMGGLRFNGSNFGAFQGRIAAILASDRRMNAGDVLAIDYALATRFGLSP